MNCLIAGLAFPASTIAQATPQQPNVVIIVADDLGYGDLSCYGATRIQTPGMDRIANEGLRFYAGILYGSDFHAQPLFASDRAISLTNKDAKILPVMPL